jgi:murein DD-endopeptidase MepM/ murein hydrolase activator NlpD
MAETPFAPAIVPGAAGASAATAAATSPAKAGAPNTEQMRALAAQFESLLLGQMLKEMRQSMLGDDDEDKASGFGGGPLADTMFSELSLALSRAGGVGLGQSLLGPLSAQAAVDGSMDLSAALARAHGPVAAPDIELPYADVPAGLPPAATAALPGRLSSAYGWRRDPIDGALKFHKGVDLAIPVGQDVPAARAGQVAFAGEMSGYGLTVLVDHGGGTSTRYAHLSELEVQAGDQVAAGQTIAKSGATGRVTGPHLHFEVLQDGQPVDPAAW